jgi:hypothetical protein
MIATITIPAASTNQNQFGVGSRSARVAGELAAAAQREDQDRASDQHADGERRPADDDRQRDVAPRQVRHVRAQDEDRQRQPQPMAAEEGELLGADAARKLAFRVRGLRQRCAWRDGLLDAHRVIVLPHRASGP